MTEKINKHMYAGIYKQVSIDNPRLPHPRIHGITMEIIARKMSRQAKHAARREAELQVRVARSKELAGRAA